MLLCGGCHRLAAIFNCECTGGAGTPPAPLDPVQVYKRSQTSQVDPTAPPTAANACDPTDADGDPFDDLCPNPPTAEKETR